MYNSWEFPFKAAMKVCCRRPMGGRVKGFRFIVDVHGLSIGLQSDSCVNIGQ